jgi:transposase-like protein
MMIRCTICKLEAEKRSAIDAALQGGLSLEEISRGCGISKSSLHRHSHHLKPASAVVPTTGEPPATPLAPTASPGTVTEPSSPAAQAPTRNQFLERIEFLWGESIEGLNDSKEPIVLHKADGSSIEIKGGDLKARPGFIREARQVLELQGEATGELVRGQPANQFAQIVIVCPVSQQLAPGDDGTVTIDIAPQR